MWIEKHKYFSYLIIVLQVSVLTQAYSGAMVISYSIIVKLHFSEVLNLDFERRNIHCTKF